MSNARLTIKRFFDAFMIRLPFAVKRILGTIIAALVFYGARWLFQIRHGGFAILFIVVGASCFIEMQKDRPIRGFDYLAILIVLSIGGIGFYRIFF